MLIKSKNLFLFLFTFSNSETKVVFVFSVCIMYSNTQKKINNIHAKCDFHLQYDCIVFQSITGGCGVGAHGMGSLDLPDIWSVSIVCLQIFHSI